MERGRRRGVNLYTQSGAHLVVDINGWYVS
jgi:hypothetical protein